MNMYINRISLWGESVPIRWQWWKDMAWHVVCEHFWLQWTGWWKSTYRWVSIHCVYMLFCLILCQSKSRRLLFTVDTVPHSLVLDKKLLLVFKNSSCNDSKMANKFELLISLLIIFFQFCNCLITNIRLAFS